MRMNKTITWAAAVLLSTALTPVHGENETGKDREGGEALQPEERSTIDTIPFASLDSKELSDTVIEGGLAPPAAGEAGQTVPQSPTNDVSPFNDPSAHVDSTITDIQARSGAAPDTFRVIFSNPQNLPNVQRGNTFLIQPQTNRRELSNITTTPR